MRCLIFAASPEKCCWVKNIKDIDFVIAADAGYIYAQEMGFTPDLVVGDFDTAPKPEHLACVSYKAEKDDTDCGIAVKAAISKGATEIFIVAGLGGRIDHTLANIATITSCLEYGIKCYLISDNEIVTVTDREENKYSVGTNVTVSVFPSGEECVVSYKGLKYPLENHKLQNNFPLGISNLTTEEEIEILIHSGAAIITFTDFNEHFLF